MSLTLEAIDPWQRALQNARLRSPASFDQWFSSVQFDGLIDGVLGLTARDEFVRDWVKTHFLPAMLGDIEAAAGVGPDTCIRVDWRISSQLADPIGVLPDAEAVSTAAPSSRPSSLPAPARTAAVGDTMGMPFSHVAFLLPASVTKKVPVSSSSNQA